jgi:hypothetical protein
VIKIHYFYTFIPLKSVFCLVRCCRNSAKNGFDEWGFDQSIIRLIDVRSKKRSINGDSMNGGSINRGSINRGSMNGGSMNGGSINRGGTNFLQEYRCNFYRNISVNFY